MSIVRFVHTADLHLDTPFKGLASWNPELANKLKDATFRSFKRITAVCIEEQVDFLIISGDIFDGENKSLTAQLKFSSELKRLSDQGIKTYFICGNHDPLNSWIDAICFPDQVYQFRDQPEFFTYVKNGIPVADIHGFSYPTSDVVDDITPVYQRSAHPAPVSIAVLHGTVGTPGPHKNYAPFKIRDVEQKGFDYWALGHIHKAQVIKEGHPTIVYPGNPQGRDFGEKGKKGCFLVEISEGKQPDLRFFPTNCIRFEEMAVDISGIDEIGQIPDILNQARYNISDYNESDNCIMRIALKGRTSLHSRLSIPEEVAQLRDYFNEEQLNRDPFTWIDQIVIDTTPDVNLEQIKKGTNFTAALLTVFEGYANDKQLIAELIQEIEEELSYQVKKEVTHMTEEKQTEILDEAKWMLLDHILRNP